MNSPPLTDMTITNGYTTLQNVSDLLNPLGLGTSGSAADNGVIERMIEGASRYIDNETGRTFYASGSSARLFDVPPDEYLFFDADLYSASGSAATVANGDGSDITAQVALLPTNGNPRYAARLKDSATVVFSGSASGDTHAVISVAGYWCTAPTPPLDIQRACEDIVITAYKNRYGQNTDGAAVVTAAGVVITPRDIPTGARVMLERWRRNNLAGA